MSGTPDFCFAKEECYATIEASLLAADETLHGLGPREKWLERGRVILDELWVSPPKFSQCLDGLVPTPGNEKLFARMIQENAEWDYTVARYGADLIANAVLLIIHAEVKLAVALSVIDND